LDEQWFDGEPNPEGDEPDADDETEGDAPDPETPEEEAPAAPVPSSTPKVKATREELEAKREIVTKDMLEAQSAQEEAKKVADSLANQVNDLNRQLDKLNKADPNHGTAGIRAYLAQQNKNRLARAEGLTRFVEVTGVHPADAAKATNPKAPIDQALSSRKSPRGSTRPQFQNR